MIIDPDRIEAEAQGSRPLLLKRIVKAEQHGAKLSLTWVRIWGHHDRVVNQESDRAYYILEGTGRFQAGDEPEARVQAGQVVFIPAGVPYEFEGEMTYLVMNGPAFVAGSDRVLPGVMGDPA
jgi:mannose-6-phosphate isomerase-like protein (cupin superfamily)